MNERPDKAMEDDRRLADKAKQLFDESVQELDASTQSRLNRGRRQALAGLDTGSGWKSLSPWVPAAGIAAAAVFAVVLWTGRPPVEETPAMATDLEILLDQDSFEMLQDLEFYSWLDLNAELGVPESGENVG